MTRSRTLYGAFMLILIAAVVCVMSVGLGAATTVYNGEIVTMTGSQPNSIIWDASNFGGFNYGFDNQSSETLTIVPFTLHGPNIDRTIDARNLVYTANVLPKTFECNNLGNYSYIVFLGDPYFTGYDAMSFGAASGLANDVKNATINGFSLDYMSIFILNGNYLSKVLIDSDDMYTIATGDGLELKEGYVLNVQKVADGRAILELTKDGQVVDSQFVTLGTTGGTYVYDELELGYVSSVPTIIVHVDSTFVSGGGGIIIGGVFQISDTPITVDIGSEFGVMKIVTVLPNSITMINVGAITLSRNSAQPIFGDVSFKVFDDSTLTFYPFVGNLNLNTPSVLITFPIYGMTVTNPTLTVSGTASDDAAVASVTVNDILAIGTTNWNADITLTAGANTLTAIATDTSGNTVTDTITIIYTPTAATIIKGDVNDDGILSSVDALMALQMSAGNIVQNLVADVNEDGNVTSLDALMILQASVGVIVL